MSDSLRPPGLWPTRLLSPWTFPGKTGVGCHSHFQGIFASQESNLHTLHWQMDSLLLSHLGSLPATHIATLLLIFLLNITLVLQVKITVLATLPWEMVITKNAWVGSNLLCFCLELFWFSSGRPSVRYWGKCAVMCIRSALSNAQMIWLSAGNEKNIHINTPIPMWHCNLVKRIACGGLHYAKRTSSFSG